MSESTARYCTIVPIGGQIVVKRDPPKERTEGGLYLPDPARAAKKVMTGVVICKGPGFIHPGTGNPVTVSDAIKAGVRVVLGEYAGTDYEHEEEHGREVYTIMQEAEVLCILGGESSRAIIPDEAVDQATLDEANALRHARMAEQQQAMQARGADLARQMAAEAMGQSPGGLHLRG